MSANAADLLDAYDAAVNDLVADEETGWDKDGCRAVYKRRIRRLRSLILRALTSAPAVGDCVLVPREPTEEVIERICVAHAGRAHWPQDYDDTAQRIRREYARESYRAMLAAAPLALSTVAEPLAGDAESVAACLGDDAAAMLAENPEDERAHNMLRAAELLATPAASPAAEADCIDAMVNRFLCWRLPQDFAPDAGISFNPGPTQHMPHCWPVGTNLFTAAQAREMFSHCAAPTTGQGQSAKGVE